MFLLPRGEGLFNPTINTNYLVYIIIPGGEGLARRFKIRSFAAITINQPTFSLLLEIIIHSPVDDTCGGMIHFLQEERCPKPFNPPPP
jgi:hypothetical protein